MHPNRDLAINRHGTRDIFLNTPNQAAWYERYVNDGTGRTGRLGRMTSRMDTPVFPGDLMSFNATVNLVGTDDAGCGWIDLDVALTVGDGVATTCTTRVAVPGDAQDKPWSRHGDDWRP